jgi:hypothetical protein
VPVGGSNFSYFFLHVDKLVKNDVGGDGCHSHCFERYYPLPSEWEAQIRARYLPSRISVTKKKYSHEAKHKNALEDINSKLPASNEGNWVEHHPQRQPDVEVGEPAAHQRNGRVRKYLKDEA